MDELKRAEQLLEMLERDISKHKSSEINGMLRGVEVTALVAQAQQLRRIADFLEQKDVVKRQENAQFEPQRELFQKLRQEKIDALERVIDGVENYSSVSAADVSALRQVINDLHRQEGI